MDHWARIGLGGEVTLCARRHLDGQCRNMYWVRARLSFVACVVLCVTGCASYVTKSLQPALPDRHDVVLDQLVVYSNFELPEQHRLLQELNAQRTDVSSRLSLPISDEPIRVYLFADAARFEEFIRHRFPTFPHRRAFFVETDTELFVYAHWGDRVAEDLRHEVAHGYLHSVVQNLPLWLDEGLAEYFEVPRGTHGLNPPHVAQLANLLRQGRWAPDLRRLEAVKTPEEMSQIEYAEAWAWVHWLLETDSPRRGLLQRYLAELRRDGTTPPFSVYVRQLGGNPEAMLVDYVRWLEARN
jgi:uncharacterized protein DUF1570